MKTAKIRGLKRRQKELNSWINFNKNIDMNRLNEYGYVYAKAKFGPWSNLYNDCHYPSGYRKLLFSSILNFYFDWKNTLDGKYDKYYLKIWLHYPRFIDTQIVAAIGDKIDYYNDLFVKSDRLKPFPNEAFNNENNRINEFDWDLFLDNDYIPESDYLDLDISDYLTPNDYYLDKRFYNKLIKRNTPYTLINNGDGKEKLFCIKKGYIWIGEIKK